MNREASELIKIAKELSGSNKTASSKIRLDYIKFNVRKLSLKIDSPKLLSVTSVIRVGEYINLLEDAQQSLITGIRKISHFAKSINNGLEFSGEINYGHEELSLYFSFRTELSFSDSHLLEEFVNKL